MLTADEEAERKRMGKLMAEQLRAKVDEMKARSTTELRYIGFEELDWMHECMAFMLRTCGLRGQELDQALVLGLQPCLRAIERHRAAEAERRGRIKLVK